MRCANCGQWIEDVEDDGQEELCDLCKDEDTEEESEWD